MCHPHRMSEVEGPAYFGADEAALSLAQNLLRVEELEQSKERYDYSYPPHLMDDLRDASRRVRSAIRYLVSSDADD